MVKEDVITNLTDPVEFKVVAYDNSALQQNKAGEKFEFMKKANKLNAAVNAASQAANALRTEIESIKNGLMNTTGNTDELLKMTKHIDGKLVAIITEMSGNPYRSHRVEPNLPTIRGRVSFALRATSSTWDEVTGAQKEQFEIAEAKFKPVLEKLNEIVKTDFEMLKSKCDEAGVPWTMSRTIKY